MQARGVTPRGEEYAHLVRLYGAQGKVMNPTPNLDFSHICAHMEPIMINSNVYI